MLRGTLAVHFVLTCRPLPRAAHNMISISAVCQRVTKPKPASFTSLFQIDGSSHTRCSVGHTCSEYDNLGGVLVPTDRGPSVPLVMVANHSVKSYCFVIVTSVGT